MEIVRCSRKVLFLDRDDTIIKDFGYLNDPKKVVLLDGLVPALKMFRDLGYEFIVTTNQSGLTRGLVSPSNLALIHKEIQGQLNLNGIRILDFYSAPYSHQHIRRKPGPGLTFDAISDYGVDLKKSIFVGDKWRDLIVGDKFGAKTILVNEAKNQRVLFTSFIPSLCLESWTQLSSKVLNKFLNGKIQNLTITDFGYDIEYKSNTKNINKQNLNFKKG